MMKERSVKYAVLFRWGMLIACALALATLVAPARASPVLWATGQLAGGSGLYIVDPQTGASTLKWSLTVNLASGGLAYDAATDKLFATGNVSSSSGISRLFAIDRFTGATTTFGGMDASLNLSFGGLAIDPVTGVMFATGMNGSNGGTQLFTINKSTGAATLVGNSTSSSGLYGCPCLFGLGFENDGTLFANGYANPLAQTSHLFTVDPGTGHGIDVGPNGVTVSRGLNYSGLAWREDNVMLSLGSATGSTAGLYRVDTATGAATLLGPTGVEFGVDGGLAFAPDLASNPIPVPEPASIVLIALGLLGLGLSRRNQA